MSLRDRIPFLTSKPRVNVLRLQGVIAAQGRGALSDAGLTELIERAFRGKPAAVALALNSPGGSPVQSALIGARIRRLAEEKNIPVVAFVEDVAASGGYWLACAADEIYADESSLLGSIGVISAGFGLDRFIARHGVDRRVHTAGESKSMLDPFRPEDPADIARLDDLLEQMHHNFIGWVTERRGAKLTDADLFTGEVWLGARAVELGLADGIGHLEEVMIERFGADTRFQRTRPRRGLLARFLPGRMAHDAALGALDAAEHRALWARFGL